MSTDRVTRRGIVAAVLAVVPLLVLSACSTSTEWPAAAGPSTTVGPRPLATGCVQAAPPGATADARAYLDAVNAAYPGWVAITESMRAEGGIVSVGDIAAQVRADTAFLTDLKAIHFSGSAAVWAAVLRNTVQQYVSLLSDMQRNVRPTGETDLAALDERRAEASGNLRVVLRLTPSTCSVLRP